jgi:hypothetical protein
LNRNGFHSCADLTLVGFFGLAQHARFTSGSLQLIKEGWWRTQNPAAPAWPTE